MCKNHTAQSIMMPLFKQRFAVGLLIGFVLTALVTGPVMAQSRWISGWTFAPTAEMGPVVPPSPPNPNDVRGPIGPAIIENQTLTQTLRVTTSGSALRLRFSNLYGATPVVIGAVSVSVAGGPIVPLTFDGQSGISIPAGVPRLSDPVPLAVEMLDEVSVSIFYPAPTVLPLHRLRQVVRQGDATAEAQQAGSTPMRLGVLLTGVEVLADPDRAVIVAFGDSITEGVSATPGGPGGWPEQLARRLSATSDRWSVVNAGIGGNRLLYRGSGPSGLERLDADALAVPGARCLIVLEGINDIGRPMRAAYAHEAVTAADLIAGYRQVIARSQAADVKIILATIMPFEGSPYFSENGEAVRQTVNDWIRTQSEADGIIDFDQAVRDPERPASLLGVHDSGDRLHPSDAGYTAMAGSIALTICD